MAEQLEYREEIKDPVKVFLKNESKPYLSMIESARNEINNIEKEESSVVLKKVKTTRLLNYIADIEQKISEVETIGEKMINDFKGMDRERRDKITKDSEGIIDKLKQQIKELEDKGESSYSWYPPKKEMLDDFERQLRMLNAIKEGKL